jgi:two-component system nitrogen regulation sensor histidine kinase NtrY
VIRAAPARPLLPELPFVRPKWVRGLSIPAFLLLCLAATLLTYAGTALGGPFGETQTLPTVLLVVNTALIAGLAGLVFFALRQLLARREDGVRRRLPIRFVLLFTLTAAAPATLVAAVMGASLNRTVEAWFDTRVGTLVGAIRSTARSFLAEEDADIRAMLGGLADDMAANATAFEADAALLNRFLTESAAYRGFGTVLVQDLNGALVAVSGDNPSAVLEPLPMAARLEADRGGIAVFVSEADQSFRGLTRTAVAGGGYVLAVRAAPPDLIPQLRAAEAANAEFAQVREQSERVQGRLLLGYLQAAVMLVLGSVLLGLRVAGQMSGALTGLAVATDQMRRGASGVRVSLPETDDELRDLGASFNEMSAQLDAQRSQILAATEEAEARRAFIAAVLEGVDAGVIRTDAAGRIVLANASAYRLLAAVQDALPLEGRGLEACMPELVQAMETEWPDRSLPFERDVRVNVGPQPRQFHVRAVTGPDGQGLVLTFDDLTWFIAVQRQAAWRDIARRIAHEIRNPLTPIQLSAERLRSRYGPKIDPNDPVFRQLVDSIIRQVGDIDRLVQSFSAAAQMPPPEIAPFAPEPLLREVAFTQQLTAGDIAIEVRAEPDLPLAQGDARLIAHALTNLVKNALEAIQGSRVRGTAGSERQRVSLTARAEGPELIIDIEDTGPGFPAQNRDRLLEPYWTTREKGVGLGLAIVQRTCADHGGTVVLRDRADGERGACVQVRLPILGGPTAGASPPATPDPNDLGGSAP